MSSNHYNDLPSKRNLAGSPSVTVKIDAFYDNGEFLNPETKEPVVLNGQHNVTITVPFEALSKELQEEYGKREIKILLTKGSVLHFELGIENTVHRFEVVLSNHLVLRTKGNKHGKLEPCNCVVSDMDTLKVVAEAESLNQAFTKTSVQLRPKNKTHNCNVFKIFHFEGRPLDYLR
jgi:hypothetical protein